MSVEVTLTSLAPPVPSTVRHSEQVLHGHLLVGIELIGGWLLEEGWGEGRGLWELESWQPGEGPEEWSELCGARDRCLSHKMWRGQALRVCFMLASQHFCIYFPVLS